MASIWPSNAAPTHALSGDTQPVSQWWESQADTNGYIAGVRFYKGGTANGGNRVGALWSSSGTQLASATFTDESGSGWQDVRFGTPVPATAGTTYVASYYAPTGQYSYDMAVAQANQVPMVSARQAAAFWDGRNNATLSGITYGVGSLSITVNAPVANLQVMVPVANGTQTLTAVTIGGAPASYTVQTINGMSYAFVNVPTGTSGLAASYN